MSVGDFETLVFATPVGTLMSRGVRTLQADDRLTAVIGHLRRLGHEGYPVLMGDPSGGNPPDIVGLLILRDADKALEHDLTDLTVREVMSGGAYSLHPDDSVGTLVKLMDTSGWGQIPVVQENVVIGIVTRTDLIRHLARVHRALSGQAAPRMTSTQIQGILGEAVGRLIDLIADHGRERGLGLYLVGGVVRDLLLERPNFDIDFVVESYGDTVPTLHDAPNFAHALASQYGGEVTTHPPFGTAKWRLEKVSFPGINGDLPHHIDFATARREFYEHPTALPSVSGGSIKLDLGRRDFTINALAVQLSPSSESGQMVDYFGGLADLSNGVIRALHSLSFTDDPTRALRAVRFATRLGFSIEPRTAELIALSRPMLGRITGERLRNELTLLLQESEPERGLIDLHERGLLAAIHPQFMLSPRVPDAFRRIRDVDHLPSFVGAVDRTDLYWHVLLAALNDTSEATSAVQSISHRLLFGRGEHESLLTAAALVSSPGELSEADARPSQIDERLRGMSETALAATWILAEDHLTRTRLEDYITKWRELRPRTNGHRLRELGLQPGPRYRHILERLRQAWLDGEIRSDAEEETLLKTLL